MTCNDDAGVTRLISEQAASLTYEALPRELVELIKQIVLDTLGVAIGASGLAPEARIVAEYVQALGGRPESTVFGCGFKAPAPWAAFVNGSLGHMLDYDDVGAGGHVGIATVPVALAVAEKLGRVSGRDFITAIAAGTDLHTRLDLAVRLPDWTMTEGWFATQLFGFLSGAITAARLRGFDEARTENSLGIAFTRSAAVARWRLELPPICDRCKPAFPVRERCWPPNLRLAASSAPRRSSRAATGFTKPMCATSRRGRR